MTDTFRAFRFEDGRLPPRVAGAVGRGAALAELLPVVHRLTRRPAGAFACASAVGGPLSPAALRALRDCFVERADDAVQDVYRRYLAARPLPAGLTHAEKIAWLSGARPEAVRTLASFDWPWLVEWLGGPGGTLRGCLDRLANFAFAYTRVNFRFTYHCNIACRHCYNRSGPQENAQRLALDTMLGVVAQMPAVGIEALNLTGGEPFLYVDDVLALVRAARAAGLPEVSVYTNGFWATSPARASEVLERLAEAGFGRGPRDHLKVSGGAYHEEFIPFERLVTLARGYHARFGRPLQLDLELAPDRGPSEGECRARLAEAGLTDRVLLDFRRIQRLGRGLSLPTEAAAAVDRPCRIVDQIVFDPDGTARPCCGFNSDNAGVRIGRVDESLRDLIKRMQNDPVLQFVASNPMTDLLEHVGARPSLLGYAGPCEVCQHALGALRDKEPLQARWFERQRFYPFWFDEADLEAAPG